MRLPIPGVFLGFSDGTLTREARQYASRHFLRLPYLIKVKHTLYRPGQAHRIPGG
jgi:hypothetical protein